MKTIEELELELQEIMKDKDKYVKEERWEWLSKLRDVEKSLLKQIEELKNKAL
jgi:hypothetical protein